MIPAVDLCAIHFDAPGWRGYLSWLGAEVPSYLKVFGPRLCMRAGADLAVYEAALARGDQAAIDVLVAAGGLQVDVDDYAAQLRDWRIRSVVHGGEWPVEGWGTGNELVAAMAHRHPDVYTAFAGVSLRDPDRALKEIERLHAGLAIAGVSLTPFIDDADVSAAGLERFFGSLQDLGLPVWLHTGQNFARNRPLASTTWEHVDAIARSFPELPVIVGHGGWPWIREVVALCQRHPNVYVECSTHRASTMSRSGSGWEPLLLHARGSIRDKVLFGSTTWTTSKSQRELADEVEGLGLGTQTTGAWLHGNAEAALGMAAP